MTQINEDEAMYRRKEWQLYGTRIHNTSNHTQSLIYFRKLHHNKVAYWKKVYDAHMAGDCEIIIEEDMHEYERIANEHDARQPFIEEELIQAIQAIKQYSDITYRQLSGHINNWC
jgi:hypothetical protein